MIMTARLSLCCGLLLTACASVAQPTDIDSVLDRVIESYGGETNLRKLHSQVQEWTIVALMGNRHGTDLRLLRSPDQLKVVLTYPDKSETRIVDHDAGTVIYGDRPAQAAVRPQLDAMRLQLMRLYSPLILRDKSDALTLTVDGDDMALTIVEEGVRADYVLDTDTWRIKKFVGSIGFGGSEMLFVTEYADFAIHDGVLVHQTEQKYAGGMKTAVLRLRRIALDADLGDSDFLPGKPAEDGTVHHEPGDAI